MKINTVGIIIILLVVAIIGGVIGYGISVGIISNNNNSVQKSEPAPQPNEAKNVQQPQTQNVVATTTTAESTTTATSTNTTTEKVQYDGSQNITVNGKSYTVSYSSEQYDIEASLQTKNTEVKLYLNDKKVSDIDLGWIYNINHEYGQKDYSVELRNFCNDYILVILKGKKYDGQTDAVNRARFCIISTNGQHIGTFSWDDATHISLKATGERLTYEVNEDALVITKISGNGASTVQYTVVRDIIREKYLKHYSEKDVNLAGK